MSRKALALGVVDRLRSALGDTESKFVFKSNDLRPPPAACSFRSSPFVVTVGRVSGQRGPTQGGDANDTVYSVQVAITGWTAYAPFDRQSLETAMPTDQTGFAQDGDIDDSGDGLEDVAEKVVSYLQQDWATVTAVNARIPGAGTTTNGFCEPFQSHAIGDVEDADASWVHADPKSSGDLGIKKIVVTLSGARRIRVQGTL